MPKFYNPYIGSIGRFFDGDPTLRGYWQLQGNSWDNSGNGSNGSDIAMVYNKSGFKDMMRSGKFNKTSSYIQLPKNSNTYLYNTWTIMAWSYVIDSSSSGIYQMGNAWLYQNSGSFYNGSSNQVVLASSTIYTNRWVFSAYTVSNGADSRMYQFVVGGPQNIGISTTYGTNSDAYLYVGIGGFRSPRAGDGMIGYISEVAIFSRALSPSEISQYYNWAISNPKRNTLIIDPSLLYNPAISRRRLLLK